jgi:integrase
MIQHHRCFRVPRAHWEVIGPFIADVISEMRFASVRKTKNYFTAVTAHVYWCWQVLGMDLERDQIFQLDVIARFIDGGCGQYAEATKSSYRGRLANVAREVLSGPGRPQPLRSYGFNKNASPPYSPREVDRLDFWARHQRTQYRSLNATLLLALCLGAGLTPAEIIALRAADVLVDDEGVVLTLGGRRPRSVAMLARWEGIVADIARRRGDPSSTCSGPCEFRKVTRTSSASSCGSARVRPST